MVPTGGPISQPDHQGNRSDAGVSVECECWGADFSQLWEVIRCLLCAVYDYGFVGDNPADATADGVSDCVRPDPVSIEFEEEPDTNRQGWFAIVSINVVASLEFTPLVANAQPRHRRYGHRSTRVALRLVASRSRSTSRESGIARRWHLLSRAVPRCAPRGSNGPWWRRYCDLDRRRASIANRIRSGKDHPRVRRVPRRHEGNPLFLLVARPPSAPHSPAVPPAARSPSSSRSSSSTAPLKCSRCPST
jgi:hypothetical protein